MRRIVRVALAAGVALAAWSPAQADHRWSTYHWQRTVDRIAPRIDENLSPVWEPYLRVAVQGDPQNGAIRGWNYSSYIESPLGSGTVNPKTCKPVAGRIQVCNARYGNIGWLGIAQIWLSGGHISQGVTKLNDTYFDTARYNTPAWRRMVMCQEVGHDYGLGHVNETFTDPNTGSCMDYTNDPTAGGANGALSNEYPNDHDFAELAVIYQEQHGASTNFAVREVGQPVPQAVADEAPGGDTPAAWGRAIHVDGRGRPDVFVQDLGTGRRKITHVFWALEHGPRGAHHGDEH